MRAVVAVDPKAYRVHGFALTRKSAYMVWGRVRADAIFSHPRHINGPPLIRGPIYLVWGRFPKLYDISLRKDSSSGNIFLDKIGFEELLNLL